MIFVIFLKKTPKSKILKFTEFSRDMKYKIQKAQLCHFRSKSVNNDKKKARPNVKSKARATQNTPKKGRQPKLQEQSPRCLSFIKIPSFYITE